METKTARHRSTETRQGRAVRWFVGQREEKITGRRTTEAMEQAELWPANPHVNEAAPVCEQAVADVEETSWVASAGRGEDEVETVQTITPVAPAPEARPTGLSRRFVTRAVTREAAAPVKPGRHIARFLNVNNAIKAFDHSEDFNRYQQPESGLSKMFRFFKGSAPANHYTSLFF